MKPMNREIKFRVFDGEDYMSSPFTLQDIQSGKIQFTSDCPVMQFTGLHDRNGKEIYEGDVVKWKSFPMHGECVIEFYDGAFRLHKHVLNDNVLTEDYANKCCEVIGNIYEHPNPITPTP
jgi:uncharacterized phage protein (TIGR01671 family)